MTVPAGGAPATPTVEVNVTAERAAAIAAERERVDKVLEMGKQFNAPDDAMDFVRDHKSPEQFQAFLLSKLDAERQKPSPDTLNEPIGMSERQIGDYSFMRVLRALDPNNTKAREAAAFELECSEAAAEKLGREAEGIVVPTEVLIAPLKRTYTSGTDAAPHGGHTVATDLIADSFIEMLRKRCLLMRLGSKLGGLVGNVAIPKQISGATGYVVGEDTDVPESEGDFGQVGLTPYTVGALSEISRKLLKQSSLDVEALIRSDLAKAVALKADNLGFYGTGTNEPKGIKATSGVNAVNFAADGKPTFAEIVQMESEVAADDADVESMAYLFNARMRGHFKSTPKFADTAQTIWEPGNTVNGYASGVTNQIAGSDIFHGNFADLFIATWGGLELTLDPYTHSAKGRLRIVAMQDMDIALRHGESFCYGTHTP